VEIEDFRRASPYIQKMNLPKRISTRDVLWGRRGKEARVLKSFQKTLEQLRASDRDLLLFIARKWAAKRSKNGCYCTSSSREQVNPGRCLIP
jgi:hypothetical protein